MLITIFCEIDDFCKQFEKEFGKRMLSDGEGKRNREHQLSLSEVMTIVIYFHYSGYKNFKDYYLKHVLVHMQRDFRLVSYSRFIELKQKAVVPIAFFVLSHGLGDCTGISIIDSFALEVCHQKRSSSNKVFATAKKGKTSVGWFYGFKVHFVINQFGEIIHFYITPGNIADNNEKVLLRLTKDLFGKVIGDKGYLINKSLFERLYSQGIHIITRARKNMKNRIMSLEDRLLLRKRGIIESVIGILKGVFGIEHSRHRSTLGFLCHICASLAAYDFKEKKPSFSLFGASFLSLS